MQIDSGILQFIPKGTFYESKDEQFKSITKMWDTVFTKDRMLFSLLMLLPGSSFSKGMMTRYLLALPPVEAGSKDLVKVGLPSNYEHDIIMYNLFEERPPRALKNLLLLVEGDKPINNSRTKKTIMEFIFNRSNKELDWLAVNYKSKLRKLIRHALGKYDLHKILIEKDKKLFQKYIGRYNEGGYPVLCHIFDQPIPTGKGTKAVSYFKMVDQYNMLKKAAEKKDVVNFKKFMKGMPIKTVMGFRNFYKVEVDLSELYEKTQLTQAEKIQSQAASTKAGKKVDIDYSKSDIYSLFKILYQKASTSDKTDIEKIYSAIDQEASKIKKINLGGTTNIIIDFSKSMMGTNESLLRPVLTSLVASMRFNRNSVIAVGGSMYPFNKDNFVVMPSGATNLWKALAIAAKDNPDNIIVFSDGYENEVKGAFDYLHKHLKKTYKYNLIHFNPVMSATAKTGSVRQLTADVPPMPLADPTFVETEIIFNKLLSAPAIAKGLLINRYKELLLSGGGES
jgi:hypothetical protein